MRFFVTGYCATKPVVLFMRFSVKGYCAKACRIIHVILHGRILCQRLQFYICDYLWKDIVPKTAVLYMRFFMAGYCATMPVVFYTCDSPWKAIVPKTADLYMRFFVTGCCATKPVLLFMRFSMKGYHAKACSFVPDIRDCFWAGYKQPALVFDLGVQLISTVVELW